ncbi:MAG TPA: NnrS family protein [Rhodospirillales bacterium]|jgi:uncharacterized protein involved in response to NO|nr:NnrS family protein [Rhodospirillales bacterium]
MPSARELNEPVTILSYGFRPFFLLTGIFGAFSLAVWPAFYTGWLGLSKTMAPVLWHGHEMLFGFAMAAATGFFLTAVPSWTKTPPERGGRLAFLVALWFAGRITFWLQGSLPPPVVAVADLALIPAVIFYLIPPILGSGQRRNLFFLVFLILLFTANFLFHLELLELTDDTGFSGLYLALYTFILMMTVLSGRMIPNFTANALSAKGEFARIRSQPLVERAAFLAIIATAAADLAGAGGWIGGVPALAAALALALRMRYWATAKTFGQPILWVLHLGHAWLSVGFACRGLAGLTHMMPVGTALHALTIGAIGTMVLAVMTRASLGHTGRPFVVNRSIMVAYVLLTLAAIARIAAPFAHGEGYGNLVIAAGLLWVSAFTIFLVVYWPVLTGPRADGSGG